METRINLEDIQTLTDFKRNAFIVRRADKSNKVPACANRQRES